jgi:predicted transcriptional regulator
METIGLKISKQLKIKLNQHAKQTDRSISSVVRLAIESFFAKGGPHQKGFSKKN